LDRSGNKCIVITPNKNDHETVWESQFYGPAGNSHTVPAQVKHILITIMSVLLIVRPKYTMATPHDAS